jgi:hypothetical protein
MHQRPIVVPGGICAPLNGRFSPNHRCMIAPRAAHASEAFVKFAATGATVENGE